MIQELKTVGTIGQPISGFTVECDCCHGFFSRGGFTSTTSILFESLAYARESLELKGWIRIGNHVICDDCQHRILRDKIEMKFIDERNIVRIQLFGDSPLKVELDISEIQSAKMTVMGGDEILEVNYKDGKKKVFDAGCNRAIGLVDDAYPVYDKHLGINLFKDKCWIEGWASEQRRLRARELLNAIENERTN